MCPHKDRGITYDPSLSTIDRSQLFERKFVGVPIAVAAAEAAVDIEVAEDRTVAEEECIREAHIAVVDLVGAARIAEDRTVPS